MSEAIAVVHQQRIDADLARDNLRRFLTEEATRMRYAKRSRDSMHAQIQAGAEPSGHRVEWVVAAADAVAEVLMQYAQGFNDTYPYDTVLLGDFLDVIATTRGRFLKAAGVKPQS